jgi:hypothetical protein
MADAPLFSVVDLSVDSAIQKYAQHRLFKGKAVIDSQRKIMRYWVHFGIKKIPKGDRRKIIAQLSAVVTQYSRLSSMRQGLKSNLRTRKLVRNASADKWRGTLAAKLVAIMANSKGSMKKGSSLGRDKFVANKAWSANLHKAGLAPAIAGAGVKYSGRLPKLKTPAGSYQETILGSTASILAENFASSNGSRAAGVEGLAPGAFSDALGEVQKQVVRWLEQDLKAAAKETGFSLKPS